MYSCVADQIEVDDEMITMDLENGFHHVKIKVEDRKYLGMYWKGTYYRWCVMPFGVKSALYFFNKILGPVVRFLRVNGIRNALFVDDFLVMMKSMLVTDHREFVLNTLKELGWDMHIYRF